MSAAPDKWRPSLTLVIFTVLATVGVLTLVGLFFFRLYDNQRIRQTQAELIAQSRVLATIYAQQVTARLDSGLTLGAEVPPNVLPDPGDQVTPIRPALDLTANDLLRRRPEAQAAPQPAQPVYVEIGARLTPIIRETQKVTLAGFRILDPQGVVIAGRQEVGQSLAHIEEIADALHGQYRATLRNRVPDKPPPSIYSCAAWAIAAEAGRLFPSSLMRAPKSSIVDFDFQNCFRRVGSILTRKKFRPSETLHLKRSSALLRFGFDLRIGKVEHSDQAGIVLHVANAQRIGVFHVHSY